MKISKSFGCKVFWVANKMLWPCINQCLTVTLNTSPILCRAGEERLSGCHWRAEKTQLGVKSVKTKTKQKMGCGKKRQEIIVVMSKRRLYAGEWLIRAPAILSLPLSYVQIFLDAAMQIGIFIGCILSNRSLLTFREGTFFLFTSVLNINILWVLSGCMIEYVLPPQNEVLVFGVNLDMSYFFRPSRLQGKFREEEEQDAFLSVACQD